MRAGHDPPTTLGLGQPQVTLASPPEIHPALLDLPVDQALEAACQAHLGVWSERKLGLVLAPLHWEWCDLAMEWSRGCVVAPREHGKALALDTPVAVPGGFRLIGQLAVGDAVLGANGVSDTVVSVSQVYTDHDCYRLTFDDGTSVVTDAGHRWWTHYAWRGRRVVTTEQIAADLKARTEQTHVIDPVLVDMPDADLPIDPYVLGCWLGDGTSRNAGFTCADQEILEQIQLARVTVTDCRSSQGKYAYQLGDMQVMARSNGRPMVMNTIKAKLSELGNAGVWVSRPAGDSSVVSGLVA